VLDTTPAKPEIVWVLNEQSRRNRRWLWLGLILTFATLVIAFILANLRMRAFFRQPLPVYGTVAEFHLTNQLGQAVTLADLRGHVWVADIIFTRCAGPCLKMSRRMKDIQDALPPGSGTKLISLTTDPRYDSPPILNKYAQQFGADPNRWWFLTGPQQEIANVASNSLKLAAMEKKPEERENAADLFIHSTIFVIVDKQSQVRGVFETTGEGIDPAEVKSRALAAIHRLERDR
jgi:protein SCO1